MLSAEKIKNALEIPVEVRVFESIDSTNTEAKRLIKSGKKREMLITAQTQTAGRGRQGKSFYSPKDTGIYLSLVLVRETPEASITAAAAAAVCKTLEELTGRELQIKWVNDIYLDGKKVCGILTEALGSAVIIGIGINLTTSAFPEYVENGGSLGINADREELISRIANAVYKAAFLKTEEFIDYYRSRSMLTGKKIYLIENNKKTPAFALGISKTGALEVMLENGERFSVSSGDVTVREE